MLTNNTCLQKWVQYYWRILSVMHHKTYLHYHKIFCDRMECGYSVWEKLAEVKCVVKRKGAWCVKTACQARPGQWIKWGSAERKNLNWRKLEGKLQDSLCNQWCVLPFLPNISGRWGPFLSLMVKTLLVIFFLGWQGKYYSWFCLKGRKLR